MAIQTDYERRPAEGKPGLIARPSLPYLVTAGYSQVDSNERVPRPGDAVIRDNATGVNAFKVPSSTELTQIVGVVAHRDQEIPRANIVGTSDAVQFADGEPIYVVTFGMVYVRVSTGGSETITYGDEMIWDVPSNITDNGKWEETTARNIPSAFSNTAAVRTYLLGLPKVLVIAQNDTPVGNNTDTVIPVKVNMGR